MPKCLQCQDKPDCLLYCKVSFSKLVNHFDPNITLIVISLLPKKNPTKALVSSEEDGS